MTASPRFQTAAIFTCYAVAGIYWGAFVATLPAFQVISGLDSADFGLLLTLVTIGGIVAMQVLGRVLHRVQRLAIPLSFTAFACGMALMGFAAGPVSFGLALLIAGAASGALDISLNMRVARIESDLGIRLFNRVHALFPFSMLVTSALVGLAREGGATPAQLFAPLALCLLGAAALEWRAGGHQKAGSDKGSARGRIRLRGALLALGGLAGLGAMMEGGAHTWSALYVETALAAGPAWGGFAAAAITLGLTTGRLLAHRFDGRMRDMDLLRHAVLLVLPAFALLAFLPLPAAAIVGFFLAGCGIGPVEPAVFRSVAKRHGEADRGRALALATGTAYAGFLLSPPLMGQVIDRLGWPPMWLMLAALAIAASLLAARIPAAPAT
jgi:predicted MFS family arabinose efflux permease